MRSTLCSASYERKWCIFTVIVNYEFNSLKLPVFSIIACPLQVQWPQNCSLGNSRTENLEGYIRIGDWYPEYLSAASLGQANETVTEM